MSKLPVIQGERKCNRQGCCCERVLIPHSPRKLRKSFEAWNKGTKDETRLVDIHLIFPMLAGRCLGRMGNGNYVYGPCKHLRPAENGETATCTIHDHRPQLCSGYPRYDNPVEVRMGGGESPGYMRGCGYNGDPNHGFTKGEIDNMLTPVEGNER